MNFGDAIKDGGKGLDGTKQYGKNSDLISWNQDGAAAGTITGQALEAGLVDEVAIDLVPVVLGEGHRYFEGIDPERVTLGDPTVVIPAKRATHLVFPVLPTMSA